MQQRQSVVSDGRSLSVRMVPNGGSECGGWDHVSGCAHASVALEGNASGWSGGSCWWRQQMPSSWPGGGGTMMGNDEQMAGVEGSR